MSKFQAVCPCCGWTGPVRDSFEEAENDAYAHNHLDGEHCAEPVPVSE